MMYQFLNFLMRFKPTRVMVVGLKKNAQMSCKRYFLKTSKLFNEWSEKDQIDQTPIINLIGDRSLENLPDIIKPLKNIKKGLLVTGPFLVKDKICTTVLEIFKQSGKKIVVFSTVSPNPTEENVNAIIDLYKKEQCDFIVSLGGGSNHDAAKTAKLMIANGQTVDKYQGFNLAKNGDTPFMISINTTAGTGAEITNCCVISKKENQTKIAIADKYMCPNICVNDPQQTLTLPDNSTVWTGIDTLVHAIESYISVNKNIQAKSYSLEAIRLVFDNLPKVHKNPLDIKARENMMYADFLAGNAFNITSLGFVHSMSHPITALYKTPHGLANAMMLIPVLKYELKYDRVVYLLNQIAYSLGFNEDTRIANAQKFVESLSLFFKSLGIPSKLEVKEHILRYEDVKTLAKKAMRDICGISNQVQLSKRQLVKIYCSAAQIEKN